MFAEGEEKKKAILLLLIGFSLFSTFPSKKSMNSQSMIHQSQITCLIYSVNLT